MKTKELAVTPHGVQPLAVQGRRRSWSGIIFHRCGAFVGITPYFLSVLDPPATNDFSISLLNQREQTVTLHCERRIAQAQRLLPKLGWSLVRPIDQQIGNADHAIPMGTAPP